MERKCIICGKLFDGYSTSKTCGKECRQIRSNQMFNVNKLKHETTKTKICVVCKTPFETSNNARVTCSDICSRERNYNGNKYIAVKRENVAMIGLRYIRQIRSLSTDDVAKMLDVPRVTLGTWEQKTSPIPADKLKMLSDIFGVEENILMKEMNDETKSIILLNEYMSINANKSKESPKDLHIDMFGKRRIKAKDLKIGDIICSQDSSEDIKVLNILSLNRELHVLGRDLRKNDTVHTYKTEDLIIILVLVKTE